MRFRVNLSVYTALFLTASLAFAQSGIGSITLQVSQASRGYPVHNHYTSLRPAECSGRFVPGGEPIRRHHQLWTPQHRYADRARREYVSAVQQLTNFNSIDGSTYDPFTNTLLFTQEAGTNGGVIEISSNWPPTVNTLYGILGMGGFEGIHPDDLGNLLIMEDVGGTGVKIDPNSTHDSPKVAKQPNSFVYRFLPKDPTSLSAGGVLQALRVTIKGAPIIFHGNDPVGDTFSQAQLDLHTPGTSYPVDWVTVHDTDVDGTAPFDANAAAKAAGATPFKRPENGQFLPGSGFLTFFFCPTGDTDLRAGNVSALAQRGAWDRSFGSTSNRTAILARFRYSFWEISSTLLLTI